jgi:hypothetical protein
MRVLDMRFGDPGVPYIDAGDRAVIRRLLVEQQKKKGASLYVQFYPQADALFFADMADEQLRFLQPTFYPTARPDLHILHGSRYVPPLVDEITTLQLRKYGIPTAQWLRWPVLHERDGTESWRFHAAERL